MNYQEYLDHQMEKTTDPVRRQKWLTEEWDQKVTGFRKVFARYLHLLHNCESALCLGARTGQEVEALLESGIPKAVGVDLVACQPYVRQGDVHELEFEDESFDFVFSNIFDHVLYPDKFAAGIKRVLKPGGYVLLNLQVGVKGDKYTVTDVSSVTKDVLPVFEGMEVRVNMPIPFNVHAMDWELMLQKPVPAPEPAAEPETAEAPAEQPS